MKVTFELEFLPVESLVYLANCASTEVDDFVMALELTKRQQDAIRARFDAIVEELEKRGEQDLSSKVIYPRLG